MSKSIRFDGNESYWKLQSYLETICFSFTYR